MNAHKQGGHRTWNNGTQYYCLAKWICSSNYILNVCPCTQINVAFNLDHRSFTLQQLAINADSQLKMRPCRVLSPEWDGTSVSDLQEKGRNIIKKWQWKGVKVTGQGERFSFRCDITDVFRTYESNDYIQKISSDSNHKH